MRKNILPKCGDSAEKLAEKLFKQLERQAADIDLHDDALDQHKSQKILTDTLHKLMTIIHQMKKLEKLYSEEDDIASKVNDRKIIEEFANKIKASMK